MSWNQLGNDIDGEDAGDGSGYSVSLSSDGSIVAIGAPLNNFGSGHVRVYKYEHQCYPKLICKNKIIKINIIF